MGLLHQLHIQQHPEAPNSCFLASRYLCDKVSDEGDVRVELLQTFANVADDGQHVSTAQKVNHAVQQSLLQLHLTGDERSDPT